MVSVLEAVVICGQPEVGPKRIGPFVPRISLCRNICIGLNPSLRHIFPSTKFSHKSRHIVLGGNNVRRYIFFCVCFSSKSLLKVRFFQILSRSSIFSHGNAFTRNHHFPSKSKSRSGPIPLRDTKSNEGAESRYFSKSARGFLIVEEDYFFQRV